MYNQNLNIFYDYNHMNDFVYHLYALYCFTTKMIQVSRASICSFFLSFFFFLWPPPQHMEIPRPYPVGAVATGLYQSHSNEGFEPRLQPTPHLTATPDP